MKINVPITLSLVATFMFVFDSAWMLGYVIGLKPIAPSFYFSGLPVTIAYPLLGAVLVLNLINNNVRMAATICGILVILDVLGFFSLGWPNAIPTALCIAATAMQWHSQQQTE
ncbi:MAG: hypothetical protein M1503_07830 [Thaumarchaeota archaeon]|nr:hypothetical protein [Nitrososphaerota archaeon]MCL5318152.1 hypothetical protein [Nitrososphaerota archaeon]